MQVFDGNLSKGGTREKLLQGKAHKAVVKLETRRRRESSKVPLGAGVAGEFTVCCTDKAKLAN